MICVDDCGYCKHERPLKDGWKWSCDAFPEATGWLPKGFNFSKVKEIKICNNGIGFEPKESDKK